MKLTRRGMLALAGAGAALAQTPTPQPPSAESTANPDPLAKAREDNRRAAETLANFKVPMSAEPAFQFRA